jgi:hypothetical protein
LQLANKLAHALPPHVPGFLQDASLFKDTPPSQLAVKPEPEIPAPGCKADEGGSGGDRGGDSGGAQASRGPPAPPTFEEDEAPAKTWKHSARSEAPKGMDGLVKGRTAVGTIGTAGRSGSQTSEIQEDDMQKGKSLLRKISFKRLDMRDDEPVFADAELERQYKRDASMLQYSPNYYLVRLPGSCVEWRF